MPLEIKKGSIIFFLLTSLCFGGDPEALTKLRESWKNARANATAPLDQKYLEALEKMKIELTRAAMLTEAVAVENEIATLKATSDFQTLGGSKEPDKWKTVRVDSASPEGYRLGRLNEGQKISLQYVTGVWRAYGGWPTESPDNATVPQHKIALILKSRTGNTTIATPQKTSETPFQYQIIEKGEYFLKMNDPAIDSNVGMVQYKVSVE
jgi:hypothetical protein